MDNGIVWRMDGPNSSYVPNSQKRSLDMREGRERKEGGGEHNLLIYLGVLSLLFNLV